MQAACPSNSSPSFRHVSVKMIEGEFVNEYTVHYLNYILPLRYTTSCHSPNSFKRFYEELSKDESLNQDIKRKVSIFQLCVCVSPLITPDHLD